MRERDEYQFVIDAYSPDTLPMARLAEYMAALARLFGEVERVHFVRLEPGSTVLVQVVEPEAVPQVSHRIRALERGKAPADAIKAFNTLNGYLAADNATGSLRASEGAEVVRFPGRERKEPIAFGAFKQPGVLDGVLIRVGGLDDTVPVHLQDGRAVHICNATRDMARRLAVHLYGPTLRVQGEGRWERDAHDGWLMKRFNITAFEQLEDVPLNQVADRLRTVEGSGWRNIDDPAAELRRLRGLDDVR